MWGPESHQEEKAVLSSVAMKEGNDQMVINVVGAGFN